MYNVWYISPKTGKELNIVVKATNRKIAAWQIRKILGHTTKIKAIVKLGN